MRIILLFLLSFFLMSASFASTMSTKKHIVYLIPGQGSDYRIFKNIEIDTALFDTVYLHWKMPKKGANMKEFAIQMAKQIDTNSPFSIVGVSLGGMIACEMKDFLPVSKVILISSAKSRKELPGTYRFQRYIPINKLVPKKMVKKGAIKLQPIYEKDRELEAETCDSMLNDKDPLFLKRTVNLIVNWKRKEIDSSIIHIHGNNDNTLTIKHVAATHVIENGSHMMTLTKGKEISELLNKLLLN